MERSSFASAIIHSYLLYIMNSLKFVNAIDVRIRWCCFRISSLCESFNSAHVFLLWCVTIIVIWIQFFAVVHPALSWESKNWQMDRYHGAPAFFCVICVPRYTDIECIMHAFEYFSYIFSQVIRQVKLFIRFIWCQRKVDDFQMWFFNRQWYANL